MTFIEWLQTRLVAHGARIDIDGDWGRDSIAALREFQADHGLKITGVSDDPTVAALKRPPAHDIAAAAPGGVHTPLEMAPWVAEMWRRLGWSETGNKRADLIAFLKEGKYLGDPAKLPWCGDATESCITKTLPEEPVPSNPFWAQAWQTFGIGVDPIVGAVGVIRWPSGSGHVGFVVRVEANRIYMIGGNQSNMIKVSPFNRDDFIAFRYPKTFPLKTYAPLVDGGGRVLSEALTR